MFITPLDYHHVVARLTQPVFHQVLEVAHVLHVKLFTRHSRSGYADHQHVITYTQHYNSQPVSHERLAIADDDQPPTSSAGTSPTDISVPFRADTCTYIHIFV